LPRTPCSWLFKRVPQIWWQFCSWPEWTQHLPSRPSRMDGKWSRNNFLLSSLVPLANHAG
jgi:hypothetical protein